MKIDGSFTIPAPRERVFALLVDPEVLRRCVPGCRTLDRDGADRYLAVLEAGVGAVKGVFEGSVTMAEQSPPERLVMVVDGKGGPGFAKGRGTLRLAVIEEGGTVKTRVDYEGDVQVGGTIASVGQRMISAASRMMAGQFFAALEAEAKAADLAASAAAAVAANPSAPPPPAPAPPPPRPVRNFLHGLLAMLRGLFHRG